MDTTLVNYGSVELLALLGGHRNYQEFVTLASVTSAFPDLSLTRLTKAVQRANFNKRQHKAMDKLTLVVAGETWFYWNMLELVLDDIALRRPYVDSLRTAYFGKPQKEKLKRHQ